VVKKPKYSLIVPVYNRPDEVEELLESLAIQSLKDFELLIVEDGSSIPCKSVCDAYSDRINIRYFFKENSGPGPSRNYGMEQANADYFIIFDSDCLIPENYLAEVDFFLSKNPIACFGGPDAAHPSFSAVQKAINFVMTSPITTGGIRGGGEQLGKFQPRSFNMGISREVFEKVGGYGKIHPGEDPDLSFRIWQAGFDTALIEKAHVFHKRRIDWQKFSKQVYKFGVVRVILNKWHKGTSRFTYWLPALFSLGLLGSIALFPLFPFLVDVYLLYFVLVFLGALLRERSLWIAVLAVWAAVVQFFSYGFGFLKAQFLLRLLGKDEYKALPGFFFK